MAFAVLLYLPSVWNGFAYDDNIALVLDTRIQEFAPLKVFTQPYYIIDNLGLYRPLVSLSFTIDWAISGGSPAWFHAMNILWNSVACVLVFLLLRRFGTVAGAAAGALLFAAHPVHVEAVANIVGRAELMAAVFSLWAMLIWLRGEPDEPPGWRRIAAVSVLYALALLSKESAIMLPALIPLLDMARGTLRRDNMWAWLRRYLPAAACFALVAAASLAARYAVLGALTPGVLDVLFDVARMRTERIMTALQAWPEIVRLFFFPWLLLAFYGPPYMDPALPVTAAGVFGALIFTGLCAGGIAAFLQGNGRLAMLFLFVPIALLPISNLIVFVGVVVAERTLYLPSLVLAAGLMWVIDAAREPARRRALFAFTAVVALAFSARTLHRIPEWDSTESILGALLRDQPDSFRGHWHFARVAMEAKDPGQSLEHYAAALRVWPFRKSLTFEAAFVAAHEGDLQMAARITEFAVERWPDDVRLWRLRAAVLLQAEGMASALPVIEQALQRVPGDSILLAMRAGSDSLPPLPVDQTSTLRSGREPSPDGP
jgi:protein O-mannosyl-transferase